MVGFFYVATIHWDSLAGRAEWLETMAQTLQDHHDLVEDDDDLPHSSIFTIEGSDGEVVIEFHELLELARRKQHLLNVRSKLLWAANNSQLPLLPDPWVTKHKGTI